MVDGADGRPDLVGMAGRAAGQVMDLLERLEHVIAREAGDVGPVGVRDMVERVIARHGVTQARTGTTILAELPPDIPPIRGRAHDVEDVLCLLVTLAQGMLRGAGGTVSVSVESSGPALTLWVKSRTTDGDDGRVPSARDRQSEEDPYPSHVATGLAAASALIGVTGGEVSSPTEANAGSFALTLPVWKREAVAAPATALS
jgi:hypothetical protein